MNEQLIESLAQQCHIDSSYVDAWGNPATVVPESKAKLLAAMGYPVEDSEALQQVMEQQRRQAWLVALPPVKILRRAERYAVELRLPISLANAALTLAVATETGDRLSCTVVPVEGRLVAMEILDGLEYQAYEVELALDLPLGYHSLTLLHRAQSLAECRLIVAPAACYKQPQIEAGQRVWGPSVQLYCLRSEHNWGVGDFTDLTYLIEQTADRGGDFVGLNPIHALYPALPESASPYSPSSRRWLNVIYIDVTSVPEFKADELAQDWLADAKVQQRLAALRETAVVDYTGVTKIKLEGLHKAYARFEKVLKAKGERAAAFNRFVEAGGDSLLQQATYDALQAYLYGLGQNAWGWPAWPKEYQDYHLPAVAKWSAKHQREINFYLYIQFLADEQLAQVDQHARQRGMTIGLYRDLAVGVSEGSTEIWANSDLYCSDASIGAPPDILGPLGQNWGLPPMDPVKLFKQQYQPIIDLFRANMRSCGALRIDHAMALLRLWWVPKGENPKSGAYVYYPIDDLLGLLALESHRNHCAVIGEDLGTVPEGIFEVLQANGVHSYRVFFFERGGDGGFISPAHYPQQAMATLTTHDMPTLRGYWNGDDLELGRELGLYPDDQVLQNLYADRAGAKQRILDSLHSHQAIHSELSRDASQVQMDKALNYALQVHMARGNSSLLSLQLEDWLEMEKPVNVPGTSDEYPNWRRKLSKNLTELFADPAVNGLTQALTAARQQASR